MKFIIIQNQYFAYNHWSVRNNNRLFRIRKIRTIYDTKTNRIRQN